MIVPCVGYLVCHALSVDLHFLMMLIDELFALLSKLQIFLVHFLENGEIAFFISFLFKFVHQIWLLINSSHHFIKFRHSCLLAIFNEALCFIHLFRDF